MASWCTFIFFQNLNQYLIYFSITHIILDEWNMVFLKVSLVSFEFMYVYSQWNHLMQKLGSCSPFFFALKLANIFWSFGKYLFGTEAISEGKNLSKHFIFGEHGIIKALCYDFQNYWMIIEWSWTKQIKL